MAESTPDIKQVLHHLQHSEHAQREEIPSVSLDPHLVILRTWQAKRLARTYADLLDHPEFSPACRFFLSDIYAPRDFSQRDHDAERMHSLFSRIMPAPTLDSFTQVIALNKLTHELDQTLLQALVEQLGMDATLTEEMYAEGYRLCDNMASRTEQIELIHKLLLEVGVIARMWTTGAILKVARVPVERAGWQELFEFAERGYLAFKPMKNYKTFASIITRRETQILRQIFERHPSPFVV